MPVPTAANATAGLATSKQQRGPRSPAPAPAPTPDTLSALRGILSDLAAQEDLAAASDVYAHGASSASLCSDNTDPDPHGLHVRRAARLREIAQHARDVEEFRRIAEETGKEKGDPVVAAHVRNALEKVAAAASR